MPSNMPGRGIPPNLLSRLATSANEGPSLGEMEGVWKELTASEMRLRMMDRLLKTKVGFNDVEIFNLGLVYNSKTMNFENYSELDDKRIVETAMKFKYKDEVRNRKKLVREKLKMRKKIIGKLGERTNNGRRILKHLHGVAEKKREELREKYEKKVEHLRQKYERNRDNEKDRLTPEMSKFEGLAVLDQEKYDGIEVKEIPVVKYGDVELDEDEKAAMRLHPKMALPRKLREYS